MPDARSRISSEAVQKATGRTREEWFALLDGAGAQALAHRDIVRLLRDHGPLASAWWAQTLASEYETARGRRVAGETASAGFEVGVQRTVRLSPQQAWELLAGPAGLSVWLGVDGRLRLAPGQTYQTADGTRGEVRTVTPGQRVRLTWHPPRWLHPSTLQVTVIPASQGATLAFHQERLPGPQEREEMRHHWQRVLQRLEGLREAAPR